MALPTRTRTSFPLSQSLPSGSSISLFSFSEDRQTENHNHRKLTNLITWTTVLCNSMKLWAKLCRAIQDGQVMVESSDKTWSTGEGNGKTLQYSCLDNAMNNMKREKDRTLKEELPRLVRCPICYWRSVEKSLQREWRDGAKAKTTPSCGWDWWQKQGPRCKSTTAQEPGMLGPWIKANWKWSNGRRQEWTSTF